jgi:hypothetical protein
MLEGGLTAARAVRATVNLSQLFCLSGLEL